MNKNILFLLISSGITAIFLVFGLAAEAEPIIGPAVDLQNEKTIIVQENSILPSSNPFGPNQKIKMVITAYSSTVEETDDTPFITASGSTVKDGIVANNLLPFGTKVRMPDIYGDKVFVVEDRMNSRKSNYHLDIWLPEHQQAKNFGAKITYVEILEN